MSDAPDKTWGAFLGVSRLRWIETVALTLLMPLLGMRFHPQDPLFVEAEFPWLVLGPLLASLRYGFAHGFASATSLICAVAFAWRRGGLLGAAFPVGDCAGLMLVAMLSGEFTDLWLRRMTKLETVNDYRKQRLDEFTRAYHLLKVSHDRLEHPLVAAVRSLRGALIDLKKALAENARERRGVDAIGPMVMGIFTSHGFIQVAALHRLDAQDRLVAAPIATLGAAPVLDPKDRMLARALTRRSLISVRDLADVGRPGDPLAIVPLEDVAGRMWAVLAIFEMPFVALQSEHLHLLAVIAGHLADAFTQASSLDAGWDHAGADFKFRLRRSWEDVKGHRIPATMVGATFGQKAAAAGLVDLVSAQRRGLDQEWRVTAKDGSPVLFIVMPLTDARGAEGYLARIKSLLTERFPEVASEVHLHVRPVNPRRTVAALLAELGEVCGVQTA